MRIGVSRWVLAALLLALGGAHPLAQQRAPGAAPPEAGEQRVALVIGNSAYADAPLKNPANDAADMAAALRGLGFEVILRTNAGRRQMVDAVREFGGQIRRGGVGLFYYAGHGVQSNGRNFLIPVGATLEGEADLEFETMDANMVLAQMDQAGNRVNIVVLDACRDNPFARSFRSAARGLAQLDAARGSFLAYATAPGSVAADGTGRNGIYTKHLLESLRQPDTKLEEVFKRVRIEVAKETGNKQIPWDASSVLGDFYFRPVSAGPRVAAVADTRPPAAPGAPVAAMPPGSVFRDCAACPEMVVIPAGSFIMGSPESERGRYSDEGPQHQVTIARPFAAGKYEVTFDEWDACVRDNGCAKVPNDSGWGRGRRPVIHVARNDVKQYAEWLSLKTGRNYRLLTEAEWEYIARAGTTTAYHTGATINPALANYHSKDSYAGAAPTASQRKTVEVGSFAPNAFGLHDMMGNVWEWVEDCKNASYRGAPSDGSAWRSGDCSQRMLRGGSWASDAGSLRSAARSGSGRESSMRGSGRGARIARTD